MSVTGLFATAGATNGGLYPAAGLCEELASTRQFPPMMGRRLGGRAPMQIWVLVLGIATTAIAVVGFVFTTLDTERASVLTLAIIILLSVILEIWSRR